MVTGGSASYHLDFYHVGAFMPIGIRTVRQLEGERVIEFDMSVLQNMTSLERFNPEIISSGMGPDGRFWAIIRWIDQ